MLKEVYHQLPLISKVPPWVLGLGAALMLIAAGVGQGVITGQSSAEVRQTLTVANAETLAPISNTARGLTTANNIPGDSSISVSPAVGTFIVGDIISIDAGGINVELRKILTVTPVTDSTTKVFALDVPLSIAHGSGVPVTATTYARTTGIATENKTRFITAVALEQGEVGRISIALENNSNQKAVARIDIEGVPPGATINATSLDVVKITDVVRQSANSFLVATNEFTVGTPLNLAFDLITADVTPPGNFPMDIKVAQIRN